MISILLHGVLLQLDLLKTMFGFKDDNVHPNWIKYFASNASYTENKRTYDLKLITLLPPIIVVDSPFGKIIETFFKAFSS